MRVPLRITFIIAVLFATLCGAAENTAASAVTAREDHESGWWPTQAMPKALVRTVNQNDFPAPRASLEMMVQSVAGLAAKAVNDGRGDEMVWVGTDNVDVEDWLARLRNRHPQLELRGVFDPWALVDRFAARGIIKGYLLYRADTSKGEINEHRRGMDGSVNVATSLAGILDGILVDESLETQAQQHGLKRLVDVRNRTQAWCFETYRDRFNRAIICTQDPRKPNVRDLAIAQQAFTVYGYDSPTPAVMKWLAPLSPILGWNGGDESQSPNDSWIEWGGGYYFPDLFAIDRPDRWELVAAHARRTWALMQKNNTRVIGFNVARFDSLDARKAYEVFARQTDGLLAILVFQYDRYEAGAGKVFWVKDRNGVEVSVVSARYSIWSHANRTRAGTPAKVAREIRQTVEGARAGELPRYDWVIAHVWSWFKLAPGSDENAEDLTQENAAAQGGVRGYTPVTWCAARLPSGIRTVSPEELIWRIRMKHHAEQTQRLIAVWPR